MLEPVHAGRRDHRPRSVRAERVPPGQRLVFVRNERYFRKDASGAPLPYLDRVIDRDRPRSERSAAAARSGAARHDERRDAARRLRGAEARGRRRTPAVARPRRRARCRQPLDQPEARARSASDPRAAWLQREELRHAISLAVDRKAFADTVFLGAGVPVFGPVTPANTKWYWQELPRTPHDPARAKRVLATIGLTDRNGDGMLEDPRGQTAALHAVARRRARQLLERGAAVIRDELKKIGLTVDVVALDGNALVERLLSGTGLRGRLLPARPDRHGSGARTRNSG